MDMISIRRAMMKPKKQDGSLPAGYLACDYILTYGNSSYFISDIVPTSKELKFEFDWAILSNGRPSIPSGYGPFGNAYQSASVSPRIWSMQKMSRTTSSNVESSTTNDWYIYAGTSNYATISLPGDRTEYGRRLHCIIEYGKAEINGVSKTISTTSNDISNTSIFFGKAGSPSNTPTYTSTLIGQFWGIKIWLLGHLFRDYRPCVRLSDNIAGFYEVTTNRFEKSVGTHEFEAGYD